MLPLHLGRVLTSALVTENAWLTMCVSACRTGLEVTAPFVNALSLVLGVTLLLTVKMLTTMLNVATVVCATVKRVSVNVMLVTLEAAAVVWLAQMTAVATVPVNSLKNWLATAMTSALQVPALLSTTRLGIVKRLWVADANQALKDTTALSVSVLRVTIL